jgi:hypothetical protein
MGAALTTGWQESTDLTVRGSSSFGRAMEPPTDGSRDTTSVAQRDGAPMLLGCSVPDRHTPDRFSIRTSQLTLSIRAYSDHLVMDAPDQP